MTTPPPRADPTGGTPTGGNPAGAAPVAGAAVPLPPMRYDLWGTPAEAKPLSPQLQQLLAELLGVGSDQVHRVPEDRIRLTDSALSPADLDALAGIVGAEHVSCERAQRMPRSRGKSYLDLLDWRTDAVLDAPDAVVVPGTDEELAALLRWCSAEQIAVVPFGGGTSVVGGLRPERAGCRAVLSVDMARFDECTDIDPISGLATLGAGLPAPRAEELLAAHGLQLGHFPQSFPYATIGGFAATRSSGQSSSGYGRFDEMVEEIEVMTPVGALALGRAPASAAGPDLRELFLGSEGTLGIITRVRLRVHPVPETVRHAAYTFPDFSSGAAALRQIAQSGTRPAVLRLSDETESAVNLAGGDAIGDTAAAPQGCLAIALFEGTEQEVAWREAETTRILAAAGGAALGPGPAQAWEHGRFGAPVLRDALLDNGALCETLETATCWSNVQQLREAVTAALTEALSADGGIAVVMCHISHIYPTGCSLYFTVVSQAGAAPHARWQRAKQAACEAIVSAGGTITHHHAVGTDHAPYMHAEVGELGLRALAVVKRELDPAGICNPAKLIAPPDASPDVIKLDQAGDGSS